MSRYDIVIYPIVLAILWRCFHDIDAAADIFTPAQLVLLGVFWLGWLAITVFELVLVYILLLLCWCILRFVWQSVLRLTSSMLGLDKPIGWSKERRRQQEQQQTRQRVHASMMSELEKRQSYYNDLVRWRRQLPAKNDWEKRNIVNVPMPHCTIRCSMGPDCADRGTGFPCRHQMEQMYLSANSRYIDLLKSEREYWHPDTFGSFTDKGREEAQKRINRNFEIIDDLFREETDRMNRHQAVWSGQTVNWKISFLGWTFGG